MESHMDRVAVKMWMDARRTTKVRLRHVTPRKGEAGGCPATQRPFRTGEASRLREQPPAAIPAPAASRTVSSQQMGLRC